VGGGDRGSGSRTQQCAGKREFHATRPLKEGVMNSRTVLMRRLVILWIVSLVFLVGCGGYSSQSTNNQPAPPTGVSVSPASVTVTAGGAQQFTAIVTPSGA